MERDTIILIAFCFFMLLLGIRLKQRFSEKKKGAEAERINKNQRSKLAHAEEPPEVKNRRLKRERRIRRFTILQLIVLFGLMIFMLPALTRDIMVPERIEFSNFFLRCLIFLFTIYLFIIGYIKVFKKKNRENEEIKE